MRRTLVTLGFLLLFSGCQSDKSVQQLDPNKFMKTFESQGPGGSTTNALGGTNVAASIIKAGMTISLTVDEDRSLNRTYTVPGSGAIDYPPLGRVMVEGLTPEEIAQTIKQALEKDYFRSATVTCAIESITGGGGAGIIYVLGSVNHPGPLLVGKEQALTVMKTIIAAGGFGQFANARKVELIRYDENGKKFKTVIDVKAIMDGAFEKDVPVRDGDWIIVREKLINF